MTIKEWLEWAKTQIDSLDAELIAVHIFGMPEYNRSWLVAHLDDKTIRSERRRAKNFVKKRAEGVPLAYLLENKEFYGRNFLVGPRVLIPRPETEAIIDVVKSLDLPRSPRFMDVGTGSGCLGITLALEYPQSYVLATDISLRALRIAAYNDVKLEGRMEIVESNLFRDLGFDGLKEHFDVVVANLPYVNKEWDWIDRKALSYEPASALYANGNNGLSMYQRFFKELYYQQSIHNVWVDYVVVEADPCQHHELIKMAEKAGLVYLRTEGFAVLFEDSWRYWLNGQDGKVGEHKSPEVIEIERMSGVVHYWPEEIAESQRIWNAARAKRKLDK